MSNIDLAINGFVQAIELQGGPGDRASSRSIDAFLQACLAGEHTLRRLFATDPESPILDDPYVGLIDVFEDLSPRARVARPRDWNEPGQFVWRHQGRNHCLPQKYILPVKPHLRRAPDSPCMVEDLSAFQAAWEVFSGGALSAIKNWNNILIAGGSVLACLSFFGPNPSRKELFEIYQSPAYQKSDIDLFLWGMSKEEAKERMEEIFDDINASLPWDAVCFRTKNAITIQAEYPKRPIQIIMRLYMSPAEILCGFDVDCCCVAYDGTKVLSNARGFVATVRQCNTINLLRRSPSYEHRLAKYSRRGYEIFYPDLDRNRIDYDWLANPDRDTFPKGLGCLLVHEIMGVNHRYYPLLYTNFNESIHAGTPVPIATLRPSNYDYAWVKIPYGPRWWDVQKVKKHVEDVAEAVVRGICRKYQRTRLHIHVITCGTMTECLEGCCEIHLRRRHQHNFPNGLFRGPAVFIRDDPGRQTIGSFNPTNYDDWEIEAYLEDDVDHESDQHQ